MARLWQVDVTRGIAVALMIVYHFLFDLDFLDLARFDFSSGPLLLFQRLIAFLFLSLVGVSLVLARLRGVTLVQHLRRVAALAGVALLITAATFVYPGPQNGMIVFGIIHFIAVAVLLGWFFTRLPSWLNLAVGVGVLAAGFYLSTLSPAPHPWLLWFGLPPAGFFTLDYYPLIPWFGVVLVGIFTGQAMDPFRRAFSDRKMPHMLHSLNVLGKNALAVYLVHQPLLFGLLLGAKILLGF